MTNYEKLFQEQMKNPDFAKAYHEARIDRMINDFLESLKEKISKDEPKALLLETIDSMQKQIAAIHA